MARCTFTFGFEGMVVHDGDDEHWTLVEFVEESVTGSVFPFPLLISPDFQSQQPQESACAGNPDEFDLDIDGDDFERYLVGTGTSSHCSCVSACTCRDDDEI
jgi:hypothetical protein